MECICLMNNVYRAISSFEQEFYKTHGLSINEAMIMCSLQGVELSSSEIGEISGLLSSHTSKVIKSLEEKKFLSRKIGKADKRQMYFSLSAKGLEQLEAMQNKPVDVPELLKPLLK